MNDRAAHANSFGPAAEIYERGRPSYPPAALDWLLPAGTPRVLDLGAGTGKLTRQIRDRGLEVTAVEPAEGMLEQLKRSVPGVPAHLGRAEQIPLPDSSADAVLLAQAWHWVDPAQAAPEIARVLTPGGRLGLLWNLRDERADWVRRLGEIIGSQESERDTVVGPPFGPVEIAHFEWTETLGPERLIDMVASRSYVILLEPDERAALLMEVRRLIATHPDLVGRTEFRLPYITECARTALL
ncbi:putative methyltransferase [Paractinoplanes abujensis]|uniref:SAM-dependent methyltransferase n=1 Tax=Paractinoplanes abujensis TaxID=882441 RepID=A0A7W7CNM3_9ACTN|nr:class I SAM-dependent methyltransferase [Actinoplanes abujensis]MBB4691861.1 SAM-dependent methyltransferase [Actinoplanes abujensis]GID16717.1 putative methyltransferase [Actinoplanes abujensis]